jgi:hypothetical protein
MPFPFSQKNPQKWSFLRKFQHRYKNVLRILNMRSKFVFSIEKAAVEQLRPGSTVCCRTDTSRGSTEQTRPVVAQDAAEQTRPGVAQSAVEQLRPGSTVCCRTVTFTQHSLL